MHFRGILRGGIGNLRKKWYLLGGTVAFLQNRGVSRLKKGFFWVFSAKSSYGWEAYFQQRFLPPNLAGKWGGWETVLELRSSQLKSQFPPRKPHTNGVRTKDTPIYLTCRASSAPPPPPSEKFLIPLGENTALGLFSSKLKVWLPPPPPL